MDLDGFKPVNDQHGRRGRRAAGGRGPPPAGPPAPVRRDRPPGWRRVCGDDGRIAQHGESPYELGLKLLEGFHRPSRWAASRSQAGLTIGYAIAPIDSQDGAGLIKLADAAMYSGKQSGSSACAAIRATWPVISLAILCANQAARVSRRRPHTSTAAAVCQPHRGRIPQGFHRERAAPRIALQLRHAHPAHRHPMAAQGHPSRPRASVHRVKPGFRVERRQRAGRTCGHAEMAARYCRSAKPAPTPNDTRVCCE